METNRNSNSRITIEIDSRSGFCFGVSRAVQLAEQNLSGKQGLVSLGDIVHNDAEVGRLTKLGMKTTSYDEVDDVKGSPVLFRAHGEPPSTYEKLNSKGVEIVDATCPVVKKLQQRVYAAWKEMQEVNGQVVIFGKKGHAEVAGLVGHTNGEAIVVQIAEDINLLNPGKRTVLFAQTTMSYDGLNDIEAAIKTYLTNGDNLKTHRTICAQVGNRVPHLKEFAAKYDVVLFVGGAKSSNGKVLFEVCRGGNPQSFYVTSPEDVDPVWISALPVSVGICGATSTPQWLMEAVAAATFRIANEKA
jgi:4-hydroxy-3-methylbut-2-en-1-yl diphosphate reductase